MDSISVNSPTCYNVFVTPKSILKRILPSFVKHAHSSKNLSCPMHTRWGWKMRCLIFLFHLSSLYRYPFCGLFNAMFSAYFAYCWWLCYFKCHPTPQNSTEVLSSVPKCRKVVMCLMEKICLLDKVCSGMSYSVVGCEFNGNKSTIYIKQVV